MDFLFTWGPLGSAIAALGAFVWTVLWSLSESKKKRRERLASREEEWIADFRRSIIEYANQIYLVSVTLLNEHQASGNTEATLNDKKFVELEARSLALAKGITLYLPFKSDEHVKFENFHNGLTHLLRNGHPQEAVDEISQISDFAGDLIFKREQKISELLGGVKS